MTMKSEQEVREKLEEFDKWHGDPLERERCCMRSDYGTIKALCWVLGMSIEEWDEKA